MKKFFKQIADFIVAKKAIFAALLVILVGVICYLNFPGTKEFSIKKITAKDAENGIIANNTTFIVETNNGSLKEVEEHLYLEPAYEYEVKRLSINKYEVDLKSDIPNDTLVNLSYVENEIPVYKWAFQTKKGLDVVSIYPNNGSMYNSIDSFITITFNNPDVEDLDKYFAIEPKVEGKFEHDGRVWKFIPDKQLEKDKSYTITIAEGLTAGPNVLKNTFESRFYTYEEHNYDDHLFEIVTASFDGINTFDVDEALVFKTSLDEYSVSKYTANKAVVKKFANVDKFINYLKTGKVETTNYGSYNIKLNEQYYNIELNKTLPVGYYLVEFYEDDKLITSTPVQVNNIAGFALMTEKDVLVWTSVDKEFKSDINVKYHDVSGKTNDNGIAILKNVNDYSGITDYLLIGDNQPLVIGLENYEYHSSPRGYIYTDRPVYKPTDTINIWGYIPLDFYYERPNLGDFKLSLDDIYYPVKVNEDGTFIAKIDLERYSGYGDLRLSYQDDNVASRYLDIYEYNLDYYKYDILTKTNVVNAGDSFKFDVKVTHITGLAAVNKEIIAIYNGKTYTGTTNDAGIVSFVVPTTKITNDKLSYSVDYDSVTVEAGGLDNTENYTSANFRIVVSNIAIESDTDKDKNVIFSAYNIDASKTNNYEELKDVIVSDYKNNLKVNIIESVTVKRLTGYYTNEYTNKKEPRYEYDYYDNIVDTRSLTYQDGGYKLLYDSINFKEDTDTEYYSYYVEASIKDKNNNTVYDRMFISKPVSRSIREHNDFGAYSYTYWGDYYYYYSYIIDYKYSKYSLLEEIPMELKEYYEKPVTDGSLLEIFFKENIIDNDLVDVTNPSAVFKNDYYPGVDFTGAYFKDGKFYRTPVEYYDYDESDSKLNIEIKPNKTEYKPQEEVDLVVKVTDAYGNLVNGKVNISVVNEAIFNNKDDYTNILYDIYRDKYYHSYTYSSYFKKDVTNAIGGEGDDTSLPRSDFGDTIYFDMIDVVDGVAHTKFKLNDQITSFRITVHVVTKDNKAGDNTSLIKTKLPLSIVAVKPMNVKTTDDVVLASYAINSANNNIKYTFKIEGLDEATATGKINEYVSHNFGKLPVGKYKAIISATCKNDKDAIEYEFEVVETAQEIAIKKTMELNKKGTITPTKNPINIEIYNKEMKNYIYYLDLLKDNYSERIDTIIAYYKALELENKYYGDDDTINIPDLSKYLTDGYVNNYGSGSSEKILTALVNFYAKNYLNINISRVYHDYNNSLEYGASRSLYYLLILASNKEPVLTDLNKIDRKELDIDEEIALALAYAFIGDYDSAKEVYNNINTELLTDTLIDLHAILATFVDKDNARELINKRVMEKESSGYIRFAIISYLMNNNAKITKKESVEITTSEGTEVVELNGLQVKRMTIFDKELNDLKFKTKSKDLLIDYYYKGKVSEIDNYTTNINMKLSGELKRGEIINLVIDVSNVKNDGGIMNIVLPSSLRLSKALERVQGIYVIQNEMDRIKLSISNYYVGKTISIPLYIVASGNYEIEPIVFNSQGKYSISNSLELDIK